MKRILFPAAVLLMAACNNSPEAKTIAEEPKDSAACAKPVNPNGESELALLMRDMAATTQSIKDSMEKKGVLPVYPEKFGKIFFATKTDSTIDKELFNGLADGYLRNLKYFYGAADKEKTTAYNAMVNSCVACHENFCGGPLKRIRKLIIPQ